MFQTDDAVDNDETVRIDLPIDRTISKVGMKVNPYGGSTIKGLVFVDSQGDSYGSADILT